MAPRALGDGLLHPGRTPVHVLAAEAKVVATVVVVVAVVATPREAVAAFAVHGALLVGVVALARLPVGLVLRRARVEVPFLAFAALLPVVSPGPRVEVLGLALSRPGLWAGWNVAVKGTLGVVATVVLSATTPVPDLLRALRRLRVPAVLVAVGGSMVRYLDVVAGEADRMRVARLSRGDDPRWLWQARATAATAGVLFVRAYERGERVQQAMLARGGGLDLPPRLGPPPPRWSWPAAVAASSAAALVAVAAAVAV